MDGSRMIRSGLVCGSGMVSGFRVVGFSSVLDIGNISRVVIGNMISYSLSATIGQ